jgi:hypothetical protein
MERTWREELRDSNAEVVIPVVGPDGTESTWVWSQLTGIVCTRSEYEDKFTPLYDPEASNDWTPLYFTSEASVKDTLRSLEYELR